MEDFSCWQTLELIYEANGYASQLPHNVKNIVDYKHCALCTTGNSGPSQYKDAIFRGFVFPL